LSSTPNDGTFSWTIPLGLQPGADNRIRITSTTNTAITDSSNADFAITPAIITPTITVTSPNGGESWAQGSTHDITWTQFGDVGAKVNFEVLKAGAVVGSLTNVPDAGTYSWTIPGGYAGTDYRIRITSMINPAITDSSDADFTITSPSLPQVVFSSGVANSGDYIYLPHGCTLGQCQYIVSPHKISCDSTSDYPVLQSVESGWVSGVPADAHYVIPYVYARCVSPDASIGSTILGEANYLIICNP
jgi:hypothetical protein